MSARGPVVGRATGAGRGRRRVVAATAACCTATLAGCGLGAGDPPSDVAFRVTEDFGRTTLRATDDPRLAGEDTVMRLTQRNADVETSSAGAFVTAIDGRAGGEDADGRTRDWQYWVDGLLADRGAASVRVRSGADVWWDRQDTRVARVGAVVGAFPRPLTGSRRPVVLRCAVPEGPACATAGRRLRAAGVRFGATGPDRALRVLVGRWAALRADPVARRLADGPRASGVLGGPTAAGFAPLDATGAGTRRLRRWGLVAAVAPQGRGATWLVTGATERDAARAADALRRDALRGRFAVLLRDGRPVALPLP